ncbi:type II toxin-antitoxin system VapC family toxin [sulfur-oxidizing endosymbiont of Gigantopelta aegis]|uniref:type II toxin-antitoxin system VapC family toxin n=1 Tax=sulfur-oxidizing endosymbiont of Gigantopelta aegis TaxID=2794934 RepID=UPI0018DE37E6|nr:type II toxin-antitoxin system VapC family toxin [sulfur-oxidizing endosymbiont of Gigantopelta aegis]
MDKQYLLDTQCWLYWNISPDKLSDEQYSIIEDGENDIYFSTVSAWEIMIKHKLKKIKLPALPFRYIPDRINKDKLKVLPFSLENSLRIENLPDHHADPFDRFLITQAQTSDMIIITTDPIFELYDVKIIR